MLKKLSRLALVIGAPVLLYGCGGGAQSGAYTVSGDVSFGLSGVSGDFTIIKGDIAPLTATSTNDRPLMYYLMVAPGIVSKGSGNGANHGECVSTSHWKWITDQSEFRVEAGWDRCSGQVSIGDEKFDYKNGNAFVIIRLPSGKLTTQQCGSFDSKLTKEEVFKRIKESLRDDSPAKAVDVYQWASQPKP